MTQNWLWSSINGIFSRASSVIWSSPSNETIQANKRIQDEIDAITKQIEIGGNYPSTEFQKLRDLQLLVELTSLPRWKQPSWLDKVSISMALGGLVLALVFNSVSIGKLQFDLNVELDSIAFSLDESKQKYQRGSCDADTLNILQSVGAKSITLMNPARIQLPDGEVQYHPGPISVQAAGPHGLTLSGVCGKKGDRIEIALVQDEIRILLDLKNSPPVAEQEDLGITGTGTITSVDHVQLKQYFALGETTRVWFGVDRLLEFRIKAAKRSKHYRRQRYLSSRLPIILEPLVRQNLSIPVRSNSKNVAPEKTNNWSSIISGELTLTEFPGRKYVLRDLAEVQFKSAQGHLTKLELTRDSLRLHFSGETEDIKLERRGELKSIKPSVLESWIEYQWPAVLVWLLVAIPGVIRWLVSPIRS